MDHLKNIASRFATDAPIESIRPLGAGLINDTYLAATAEGAPDYVLQRINTNIFTDPAGLQGNIVAVTRHLASKLPADADPSRRVLTPVALKDDPELTYFVDDNGETWRMTRFISDAYTFDTVNPHYARHAGRAFGEFEAQLTDIKEELVETIPNFHNMEFRLEQLREAIAADAVGRLEPTREIADKLLDAAERMTAAERLHREGRLPKRICHCDTKVNNMLFDADGRVLCVIDLDTVMPSFVFSDFGDFLRTAANTGAEDASDLSSVNFDLDIFRAFAEGYIESAGKFLTATEREMLPFAATLFPYMQAVRFYTDYLNGDTYYKINGPEHNLTRTLAQMCLWEDAEAKLPQMREIIASC
ncbi:MAG: aminoglycoside phosphotransferase family protein [Paramuribaculum sp.]|nr:aminoglycoside phosphotransferase family protein [Paramuribaculum sp.]